MPVPAPLLAFIALFNAGRFWDSHEALERAWRENRSRFYHGLILYASAWVHDQRRNPRGAAAQFRKAEAALAGYRPAYLGMDVGEILARPPGTGPAPHLVVEDGRIRGDEAELGTPGDAGPGRAQ